MSLTASDIVSFLGYVWMKLFIESRGSPTLQQKHPANPPARIFFSMAIPGRVSCSSPNNVSSRHLLQKNRPHPGNSLVTVAVRPQKRPAGPSVFIIRFASSRYLMVLSFETCALHLNTSIGVSRGEMAIPVNPPAKNFFESRPKFVDFR